MAIDSQIPKKVKSKMFNLLSTFENGIFVDVGAFDGINYSNTYELLKKGWFGIYIEPNKESCEKLKKNCSGYSYTLHEFAASNEDYKEVDFYHNGEFSSLIYENEVVKLNNIKQKIKNRVKTITLNTVLKNLSEYHLLSIDVEKHEIEVLSAYEISKHNPFFAIIETHDKNNNYTKKISKYCDEYFKNNDYIKFFSDRVNTIYCRKKIYYKKNAIFL